MIFSLFEMNTFEWKNISLHHSNHWRRHCDGLTGFIYFSSTMKKFKFTFVFSLKFSFLREMKYTTNASLKSIKMWQMVCDKLTEGGSMIWMVHLFENSLIDFSKSNLSVYDLLSEVFELLYEMHETLSKEIF